MIAQNNYSRTNTKGKSTQTRTDDKSNDSKLYLLHLDSVFVKNEIINVLSSLYILTEQNADK